MPINPSSFVSAFETALAGKKLFENQLNLRFLQPTLDPTAVDNSSISNPVN